MLQTREFHQSVFQNGAAVLLARIVDRDRRPVRPGDVAAIAYSLHAINTAGGWRRRVFAGPLAVDSVLFHGLQTGREWSLDTMGYNWRHELCLDDHRRVGDLDRRGVGYELRYKLRLTAGAIVPVRFHLRSQS